MSKRFFILIVLVLVIGLMVWQFFIPAFLSVSALRTGLDSERGKLEETKKLNEKLKSLGGDYVKVGKDAEKIFDALPKKENIPGVLIQMEAMASQNGLILNSIDFSNVVDDKKKISNVLDAGAGAGGALAATVPTSPLKTMKVGLSLSGNYQSLKDFLKATESSLRIMDVNNISFGNKAKEEGSESVSFKVDMIVYYR